MASEEAVELGAACAELEQLDETVATVFRQIATHRFEDALHSERRERGELAGGRVNELWLAANREMFGDRAISSCCARGARVHPNSSPPVSASTLAIWVSGPPAWT